MKGLGIFLLLIAIVAGLVFWSKSKNTQPTTENNESVSDEAPLPGAQEPIDTTLNGQKNFDTEKSIAQWTGSKKIVKNWTDRGTIKIKQGFASFENGVLKGGEVVFDMNTITATSTGKGEGQDYLSTHLKSDDFFAVSTYPESKFIITSVAKESGNIYQVTGDLTIKGKTNPVSFPAEVRASNGQTTIIGGLMLDRTLWEVKFGSDKFFQDLGDNVISDEFSIEFTVITK